MNTSKPIKNTETAFKAVVYWKYKKGGKILFTPTEIKEKRNRVYFPSHDYVQVKEGKTITNHKIALSKLETYLQKCADKFYTALIIFNSAHGEVLIRKYIDGKLIQARDLDYKAHGANLEHVIVSGFCGLPIKLNEYEDNEANYIQDTTDPNTKTKFVAKVFQNLQIQQKVETRKRPSDKLREQFGT